jgi:hypothetical protein
MDAKIAKKSHSSKLLGKKYNGLCQEPNRAQWGQAPLRPRLAQLLEACASKSILASA